MLCDLKSDTKDTVLSKFATENLIGPETTDGRFPVMSKPLFDKANQEMSDELYREYGIINKFFTRINDYAVFHVGTAMLADSVQKNPTSTTFPLILTTDVVPSELTGVISQSNLGMGGTRAHTSGKVDLQVLKVLGNGLETAKRTFETDKGFKPTNAPITVGVDVETGEKQLLDGYHRYLAKNGKGELKANYIPMRNGDIISFDDIKTVTSQREMVESPDLPSLTIPENFESQC